MSQKKRKYSPNSIMSAQTRVLKLVDEMLSQLPPKIRTTLYVTESGSLWTFDEVQNHVRQAAELKSRPFVALYQDRT